MKQNEERKMIRSSLSSLLFSTLLLACTSNKNLAQTKPQPVNNTLHENINNSKGDTEVINPHLTQLAAENDLVIAFGTLNFAWARKGTFYVLASQNNSWKLYSYDSKLPASPADVATKVTPQNVSVEAAEKIKQLYFASKLWETEGDEDGNYCDGKNNCNINDAETWTLSVATSKNIHTTTYYAPQFFDQCCPGNLYRKQFIAIATEMMKMGKPQSSLPEQ